MRQADRVLRTPCCHHAQLPYDRRVSDGCLSHILHARCSAQYPCHSTDKLPWECVGADLRAVDFTLGDECVGRARSTNLPPRPWRAFKLDRYQLTRFAFPDFHTKAQRHEVKGTVRRSFLVASCLCVKPICTDVCMRCRQGTTRAQTQGENPAASRLFCFASRATTLGACDEKKVGCLFEPFVFGYCHGRERGRCASEVWSEVRAMETGLGDATRTAAASKTWRRGSK